MWLVCPIWRSTRANEDNHSSSARRLGDRLSHVASQVHAKILSAGWTSDGLHLALGFIDGQVGIRDAKGVEEVSITR